MQMLVYKNITYRNQFISILCVMISRDGFELQRFQPKLLLVLLQPPAITIHKCGDKSLSS